MIYLAKEVEFVVDKETKLYGAKIVKFLSEPRWYYDQKTNIELYVITCLIEMEDISNEPHR